MARVNKGLCPSCFKEREVATFKFGIINTTMCVYCLKRYLSDCVIPMLELNNRTCDDNIIAGGDICGRIEESNNI